MLKVFNTTGICVPEKHYMVDLSERLREIKKLIDSDCYFVINRARQYGKTTTLRALCSYLKNEYYVVFMDFQTFGNADFSEEHIFASSFAHTFIELLDYNNIHQKCRNNCKFHQTLSENFSNLILNKVMDLNTRVEILTKRSIREKLRGYFNILSTRNLSKTFTLPFSLTDLADYLSVDRSAMMREIKALKDEGFIKKNGNKITLLYK